MQACGAVANGVEQGDEATGVADGLLVPRHWLVGACKGVTITAIVRARFVGATLEVDICGANEQEGMHRTRDHGEEGGLCKTVDIVEA